MNPLMKSAIRKSWFVATGVYYGFPLCCAIAMDTNFCFDTKDMYPNGPWVGSGFVEQQIKPNRVCKSPFPDGDLATINLGHKDTVYAIELYYHEKQGASNVAPQDVQRQANQAV
jgi:hypothetical protein